MHCSRIQQRSWPEILPVFVLFFASTLFLAAEEAAPAPKAKTLILADFSKGDAGWRRRKWRKDGSADMTKLAVKPLPEKLGGTPCLELPLAFPDKLEAVVSAKQPWDKWSTLRLRLYLPADLPPSTFITVFTKDWDHLWRQVRLPAPPQRDQLVDIALPISGPEAEARWEPRGHERPWNPLTPRTLLEYGVSIEPKTGSHTSYRGTVLLQSIILADPGRYQAPHMLGNVHYGPRNVRVGERFELSFTIADDYVNPFSEDHVKVEAAVTLPDGTVEHHRGFYYEGFLFDPRITDKTRTLTPSGKPCFKVRFCPRMPGKYSIKVTATVEGRSGTLPPISFTAQEASPSYHGFLRRDPKNVKYLMWDDGTPFWGIGLNVRSPFDNRYLRVAPYSRWRNEGLPMYGRLFRRYREAGIDMVEVWMSSWWLALEWINDAPGFHGVGYYNPYRAWMLDWIVEQAEANGIGLILVFNNHGKFGALNDTEWARCPYNKANGGFLDNCEQYFTNERARQCFRRVCDYIVARWGYSPHILAWKLFTEIDLTGTSYSFYQTPPMAQWHKEMGAYLKHIDPYQHLVTTHWMLGYHRINDAVALLPELDFLTTDAYYQGGSTPRLLDMLRGGDGFAAAKKKPLLITEYGGSPHADSMGNLIKQAHLGIWTGFFHEAPAAPMFWWFALIDEKNLYSFHTALRHYTDNEDRRGMSPSVVTLPKTHLVLNELRDKNRLYGWGFDAAYYLSDDENLTPARHEGIIVETKPLLPGTYRLELWDVAKGTIEKTETLTVAKDQPSLKLTIPPFTKDFAFKIKPATPTP